MPNRRVCAGNAMMTPAQRSRRFRRRLAPTLIMLVAVSVFVIAGNWQRARMQMKESLRARYDASAHEAPALLSDLAATGDWAAQRFRTVVMEGEYDVEHQILVDNKVRAGRVGYDVVTPLKLDDARVVLVDRGWVPLGPSRATLPDVPPPPGRVTVRGRLDLPPAHYLELRSEASTGPVWQNLDPARIAKATGLPVLPAIVEETEVPSPADGLVRDWPLPDFGVEQHRMYMLQWYAFAALAVVLWGVLNRRKAWRR
jgi:surfeit locus 1 family protein